MYAATEPLRRVLPDIRWVPEHLLHLTVKFLGERDDSFVGSVTEKLDGVASGYAPLPITLGGVGAFPNLRRPAVVWIGVTGDSKLELLNHDVEFVCSQLGVEVEGRAFRPHVTLARIRGADAAAVRRFAQTCDQVVYEEECRVNSLDLMLSEHRGGQLVYTLLNRSALTRNVGG